MGWQWEGDSDGDRDRDDDNNNGDKDRDGCIGCGGSLKGWGRSILGFVEDNEWTFIVSANDTIIRGCEVVHLLSYHMK
jgi:hypothetical protein